jgi:bacterioferritin (cytochrome b1)
MGGMVLVLSGCVGPFSTGASMQIDVEVYKGPLSKEPSVQWSELLGLIRHVRFILGFAIQQLDLSMVDALGYSEWKKCWNAYLDLEHKELCTRFTVMKESVRKGYEWAGVLSRKAQHCDSDLENFLRTDALASRDNLLVRQIRGCYKDVLHDAVAFAQELSVGGFVVAYDHVPFAVKSRRVRSMQVAFANLASEFGNQIIARADSLLKQMQGEDRRVMPVSIYLRDAGQTDFLNLFVWNHAGAPSLCEEGCGNLQEVTRNRVRTVERLFADHNWSKINSVHASGQGEVRMAFIKDELGNWNLKNFDNDPTELLKTYKDAGLAAVKTAIELAGPGAKEFSAAQRAINFGNRVVLGRGSGEELTAEFRTLQTLHKRAVTQLEALRKQVAEREAKLPKEIEAKERELEPKRNLKTDLTNRINGRRKKRPPDSPEQLRKAADEDEGRAIQAQEDADRAREQIAILEAAPRGADDSQLTALQALQDSMEGAARHYREEARKKRENATEQEKIDAQITSIEAQLSPLEEQIATLEKELTSLKGEQVNLSKTTVDSVRKILDDHGALIDGLFEVSTEAGRERPVLKP